jgi:hypothetical protein
MRPHVRDRAAGNVVGTAQHLHRVDAVVVDEPLYAYYLDQTRLDHPGIDEVIAAGERDWSTVVQDLTEAEPAPIYYQKHMTHHLIPQLPREWIAGLHNVLLIRDPAEVVASYVRARSNVAAADIGLVQQAELFDQLDAAGLTPPIIDATDFLQQPQRYLRWLCADLDVSYTDAMLTWPPGPRDSDGVWARHWYEAVWRSTGFETFRARAVDLSGAALSAAVESRPHYQRLHERRVRLE